ncbi:retrovirus-related pol polyprotein from transposon TNT 1-94 [Tanacetum coccineum]
MILVGYSQLRHKETQLILQLLSPTEYDSADESSVCNTPFPPLKKLNGAEPTSGPKTIKSILRSKSTFKAETLKGAIINKPSSAPDKGNKNSSASVVNSAPAGKLKSVKIEDDPPLAIVMKELNNLKLQFSKNQSSYSRSNQPQQCDIKNPVFGTWTVDAQGIETGFKSYLHKYVEQPRRKVVFGDDSTCTTEGYGSIKCNGIVFTKVAFVDDFKYNLISISQLCDAIYIVQFDEKRGTVFNSNKEVVMITPRVKDVYVLVMTSSSQESCFFAKASENINWLWHKRLAHLNFKTINKLAKQNLVIGLPLLVYSKDKPCSLCEKGKHHWASFKTKQTSSIKKCLHLLHMDLFGPITPRFINHEKYTLVIIDEYSRYTRVYFLKKKSQAPETVMSFIKRVENQNDIKVKQLRTNNGIEFRNNILINFCDEERISQNFYSSYTPEQNGVAERKNKTLIEAARTMLSGSTDEIFNDNLSEHSNHNNDEQIIDNLPNTENIQIFEHLSSLNVEDTSVQDTISIPNPPLPIPSVGLECSQKPWPNNLVLLQLMNVSFVDFLSEEEPKKVSEALKHPGWVDAMQDELNQFSRNKVWTLVPVPYGKTIIGSKWVFRNKRDETGIVIKNKARLLA